MDFKITFLDLNSDCIRETCKYLTLKSMINLAFTCKNMLEICKNLKLYRNIYITDIDIDVVNGTVSSKQLLSLILDIIGTHVQCVIVDLSYDDKKCLDFKCLELLYEKCTNLKIIELQSPHSETFVFKNLIEMKFGSKVFMSKKCWKNIFQMNNQLEILEFYNKFEGENNKCIDVLKVLLKLNRLSILDLSIPAKRSINLTQLSLTSFRFTTSDDQHRVEPFLLELARNDTIKGLFLCSNISSNTYKILSSFEGLQHLNLKNEFWDLRIPKQVIFPKNLTRITLHFLRMSMTHFVTIVMQLEKLDIFDICDGKLYFDEECNSQEVFPTGTTTDNDYISSRIIQEINNELWANKRILEIVFIQEQQQASYVQYSDNLVITGRRRIIRKELNCTIKLEPKM